jgi:uncharacterized repeat protein (TIGR01451 family)
MARIHFDRTAHSLRRLTVVMAACVLVGCSGVSQNPFRFPYLLPAGDIIRTHAKPPIAGPDANFDPKAVELTLEHSGTNVNQVRSQHVLLASVCDAEGNGLRNRRVEWHVSGVGHLVEVDETGLFPGRGYLVDDKYAVSYTNYKEKTITRGNDNPADDVVVRPGQTWAVITSDQEGETHVTAYAPGVHDWSKHKKFVIKHWVDADAILPPSATNPVGVPHDLVTQVVRHSDKTAASGYRVRYQILDGPPAVLTAPGAQPSAILEVPVDQEGRGIVRLQQATPASGVNRIKIDVVRPATSPTSRQVLVASGEMQKHWVAPNLTIEKLGPELAAVGDQITYTIRVANTGQVPTSRVTIRDTLPPSLQLIGTNPITAPQGSTLVWQTDPIQPGSATQVQIVARATAPGVVTNVAEALAENMPPRNASKTTRVVAGRLVVTKTGPTDANVGDPVNFRVTIKNVGDGPAVNIGVTDSFDPGFATASGAPLVLPLIPRLDPGQETYLDIRLVARTAGRLCNVVVAKAENLPDAARAQACVVVEQPKMEIVKEFVGGQPLRVFVGGKVAFQITVRNTGKIAARDVVVRDNLPPELRILDVLEGSNGEVSAAGNTVQFPVGHLEPGGQKTVGFRAIAVAPGRSCNSASVVFGPYVVQSEEKCLDIFGVDAFNVEVLPNKNPVLVTESPSFIIKVLNPGQNPLRIQALECHLPRNLRFEAGVAPNGQPLVEFGPQGEWMVVGYRGDIVIPAGRSVIFEARAKAEAAGISKVRVVVVAPSIGADRPYVQEQSITVYNPDDAVRIERFPPNAQSRPAPNSVPSLGPINGPPTTTPVSSQRFEPATVKESAPAKPLPSFSLRLDAPPAKSSASSDEGAKGKAPEPLPASPAPPKASTVIAPPPPLEFPDLPKK